MGGTRDQIALHTTSDCDMLKSCCYVLSTSRVRSALTACGRHEHSASRRSQRLAPCEYALFAVDDAPRSGSLAHQFRIGPDSTDMRHKDVATHGELLQFSAFSTLYVLYEALTTRSSTLDFNSSCTSATFAILPLNRCSSTGLTCMT